MIPNSSGMLLTNPVVGNSVYTQNNAKLLFSPRVGVAWDVFGNGKTAVRAGFGTYYSMIDDLAFLLNSLPPYNGSLTFSGALSSIVPVTPGVPNPPSCSPTVTTGCAMYAPQGVQANAKTPTVEAWNLSVEQQLNKSTAFRVAYVGSHGYHGYVSVDENAIPSQICAIAAGCLAGGIGTTSTVAQGTEYIPGDWERRGRIRFWERASSGLRKATAVTTRWKRKCRIAWARDWNSARTTRGQRIST